MKAWTALCIIAAMIGVVSCTQFSAFSNSTEPIWAPAADATKFVLLRPQTQNLSRRVARMVLLVSAAQDNGDKQQTLAMYRLFVNGIAMGMGPGRGEQPLVTGRGAPIHTAPIFDTIEVPTSVIDASPDRISVSLQCWNPVGDATAWAMLEAHMIDAAGHIIGRIQTNSADWYSFSADSIFSYGTLDTGGGHFYVNEDIDARAAVNVSDWRTAAFDPSVWTNSEPRSFHSVPIAKTALPLAVQSGLQPTRMVQTSDTHYFFDFGQEKTGGIALSIPAGTVQAWGGGGGQIEVRLSEQLGHFSNTEVLWPGWPVDPDNWNKIPKWSSTFTLANGENYFEQHEYVGVWRYGEIRVKSRGASDAGLNFSLTQWTVSYPWEDEATFASNDPLLNNVWRLCHDTIKYNVLDTFTDSNVRERCPYEADGFVTARSYWAVRSEREFVRHSTRWILNNPTWPTEWKQYSILLTHAHYMQTADSSIADEFFDLLVNNTMMPFIDQESNLVNFTNSMVAPEGNWIGPFFNVTRQFVTIHLVQAGGTAARVAIN